MNQQETIEEIANLIAPYFKDPIDITCPYCKAAEALYNAGLRFVPDELPLLTDEGIYTAVVNSGGIYVYSYRQCKVAVLAERALCQKALEGE